MYLQVQIVLEIIYKCKIAHMKLKSIKKINTNKP